MLGSIAQIDGLSEWSDEQIADLAFVAHEGMLAEYQTSVLPRGLKGPGVTTTLVVDNTAYISSSASAGGSFLYLPNGNRQGWRFTHLNPAHPCTGPVQNALLRCQAKAVNFGTGHRTGANCGEPMAALAFCATNNQRNLVSAKILTIVGKERPKIVPPCARPDGQLVSDFARVN